MPPQGQKVKRMVNVPVDGTAHVYIQGHDAPVAFITIEEDNSGLPVLVVRPVSVPVKVVD